MLVTFVILYIALTLAIGLWASRRIHSSMDFNLAGKSLSTTVVGVTIFATWFGPELVMGMPSMFVNHGIMGIIPDQFGVLLCLVLIGAFYSRQMYRLNIVTINDFFRIRYNRSIEFFTSLVMLMVYFAWIAAQFLALALLFKIIFGITVFWGVVLGASIVLIYTYVGGMWAVSYTDLIQSVLIIIGMVVLFLNLLDKAPDLPTMLQSKEEGFLHFLPKPGLSSWFDYIALWMAFGVGSIPSQEIYQRIFSARSIDAGTNGVFLSGAILFIVGMLPISIGLISAHLHPELMAIDEGQNLIPDMVVAYMSTPVQVLFFGALISAILSTSSGALLAPATIIGENIVKPLIKDISDKRLLLYTRLSTVLVAVIAGLFALSDSTIHDLVVLASVVMMVSIVAPFTFGIYWKKTSIAGTWISMLSGIITWILAYLMNSGLEPTVLGTLVSVAGLVVGSLIFPDNRASP